MPGKQVPLRRSNPRRSGRVRYAGFLAGLQGTVVPMELSGGLATVDLASPGTVPIYLAVRVQTPSSSDWAHAPGDRGRPGGSRHVVRDVFPTFTGVLLSRIARTAPTAMT